MQFLGNVYPLRTMMVALSAPDAMVGLAQLGHTTVITHQEGTASLAVVLVLTAFWHIAFVHALVVVQQDGRNVYAIGARHAILAIVARNCGILLYEFGGIEQELRLIVSQWHKRRERTYVVLKMLHVCHATKHSEDIVLRAEEAECP